MTGFSSTITLYQKPLVISYYAFIIKQPLYNTIQYRLFEDQKHKITKLYFKSAMSNHIDILMFYDSISYLCSSFSAFRDKQPHCLRLCILHYPLKCTIPAQYEQFNHQRRSECIHYISQSFAVFECICSSCNEMQPAS